MVCRECGAYNAEHLTHCRVCAAKLRDADASAATTGSQQTIDSSEEDAARPARSFVSAPSWPTRAFAGASEPTAYQAAQPTPAAQAQAQPVSAYAPLTAGFGAGTTVSQAPQLSTCPNCCKPALPDAPFCPYCGQPLATPAAAASVAPAASAQYTPKSTPAKPAASAKKAAPVKRAPIDDYDDEDEFDDDDFDDDEFDDEPRKKKGKGLLSAKPKKAKKRDDDFDEDDEFDDDDFDDDDEFDDDEEDFDDMPKKPSKKTTLIFWGLILLLVALIVVFGSQIVKNNFGGDASKMFASITSIFGSNKNPEEGQPATVGIDGAAATAEPIDLMNTATLTEYTDPTTGDLYYDVDIYAPTGSTIRIISDAELQQDGVATVPSNDHVLLRIGRDVFMPNKPCDSETVTISPNIQVDTPTGETIQLTVDDIIITVPSLNLSLTDPATDTLQQSFTNAPFTIAGTVDDHTVEVYVNDEKLPVYDGGIFTTTYTPKRPVSGAATATSAAAPAADATATDTPAPTDTAAPDAAAADDAQAQDETAAPDAAVADGAQATEPAVATEPTGAANFQTDDQGREIVVIEARKNNYVTARKVLTIEPFVMQTVSLNVTNSAEIETINKTPEDSIRAVNGIVTLKGTVTPGVKLSATCDDGVDLTFGEPTIGADGAFTLAVNVPSPGSFGLTLTASGEGFTPTELDLFVERAPDEKVSAFEKRCTQLSKDYDKIAAGEISSGNYMDKSAKVTEILTSSTPGVTLYKVDIGDGKMVVCAHRSLKSSINSGDVGEKKQLWGTLRGTYTDGSPLLWVWFSKNN